MAQARPRAGQATYTPALRPARGVDIGRIGLFIGGYFALAFTSGIWGQVHHGPALVRAVISAAFVGVMALAATRWRGTEVDPLGVLAALGATGYLCAVAADVGLGLGLHDRGLFWFVVVIGLPAAFGVLLWYPHPLLGLNVAIGALALISAAPIGDAHRVGAGKSLLLGLLLLGLAATVDLRTRSRAGSVLHYAAIVALVVAKLWIVGSVGGTTGRLVLPCLAGVELAAALLLRRRGWAISGWVTLAVATMTLLGIDSVGAAAGGLTAIVVAAPIVWLGIQVQRDGEALRRRILDELPPDLAAAFPD